MTVKDLCTRVMRDLGVIGATDLPEPEDVRLFVDTFNDWIDALKTESLSVFAITRQTWPLTTAASYTVGLTGTVNIDRPINPQAIVNIGYQDTSLTQVQEVLFGACLTVQDYASIPQKALTSRYPTQWYYNATFGSTGFGTLTPWPIPTASLLQGVIYAPSAVAEVADENVALSLPPGYRRFLRTNMVIESAPSYSAKPSAATMQAAADSMAQVKRANIRLVDVQLPDAALFGGLYVSNIYSGQ